MFEKNTSAAAGFVFTLHDGNCHCPTCSGNPEPKTRATAAVDHRNKSDDDPNILKRRVVWFVLGLRLVEFAFLWQKRAAALAYNAGANNQDSMRALAMEFL